MLAKATTTVNETIRHHKLAAKEIQFSRDLTSSKNLPLADDKIAETIANHREANNPASARAKSKSKLVATEAGAEKGQLVFIKDEGRKNSRRDIYMVIDHETADKSLTLCKIRDVISNRLASMVPHDSRYRYRVKQTDVILAPNQPPPIQDLDIQEVDHPVQDPEEDNPHAHRPFPRYGNPTATSNWDEEEIWYSAADEEPRQHDDDEAVGQVLEGVEQDSSEGQALDHESNSEEKETDKRNAEEDDAVGQEGAPGNEQEEEAEQHQDQDQDQVSTGESSDTEEEITIEDLTEQEDEHNDDNNIQELTPKKFPTKGKYIKFRRQADSTIEKDFHIPTTRFLYAQITNKLKADKFGRVYFNIKLTNNLTDGIYLALKNLTRNDFIWSIVKEEDFLRQQRLNQLDGAAETPESITPGSSPTSEPNQDLASIPNLDWDHSPERLTEDDAFLWEEAPLQALTASDILDGATDDDNTEVVEEEAIRSPLGVFKRQKAVRRSKATNRGYASQSVCQPQLYQQVQLQQANNLDSVLQARRPIIPELVALDDSQLLDIVLPPSGTEDERFIN